MDQWDVQSLESHYTPNQTQLLTKVKDSIGSPLDYDIAYIIWIIMT